MTQPQIIKQSKMKPGPYINSIIILWFCSQGAKKLIGDMESYTNKYNNQ